MSDRLGALFAPRGVAVVGASRDPGKLGAALARSVRSFPGHVGLVNARDPEAFGSVREAAARGPVDLAMICVPAAASVPALAEAAEAGARAAIVYGGGFAEAGADGVARQRELAAVAASAGIRVLGPNTSGFFAPGTGLVASFVPGAAAVPAGRIGVVAASGGVNHALAFLLAEAGHGVSLAVGLGNGADVTTEDVLDHLAGRDDTSAVALHIESVADGRRLVGAVARLVRTRPVVALVVGRHEVSAFAASHTGALATSWRVTRAALAEAGAVLVDSERELVDAVGALSLTRLRPAADPGVGVVTAQAGPGLLLLDDLRGRRVRVPELALATRKALSGLLPPLTYQSNPVDTGRPGPTFGRVVDTVAADPEVDLVAGYALAEPDAVDLTALAGAAGDTPMVLAVGGAGPDVTAIRRTLQEKGVPAAPDPSGLATMVAALVADARARSLARPRAAGLAEPMALGSIASSAVGLADPLAVASEEVTAPGEMGPSAIGLADPLVVVSEGVTAPGEMGPSAVRGDGRAADDAAGSEVVPRLGAGPWDEDQAKRELERIGVRTMPRRACADRASARRAFEELPRPVAVKLLDAEVLHKTEIGGVHLGVRTPEELERALDAIEAASGKRFLVETMAPGGVDLVVGCRRDPVFGAVVLCGLGGTAAEAVGDVAVGLAPVSAGRAAALPEELAGRVLLDGWRGGPVLDRAELASVLVALGDLLVGNPGLSEFEINPLRLTAEGLIALDAVAVAGESEVGDGCGDQ